MDGHDGTASRRRDGGWLLHVDEQVRVGVHSMLVEALGAVVRTPAESWSRSTRPASVVVRRALSRQEGRRSASFSVTQDMVSIVSPAYRSARRHRLEVAGPPKPGGLEVAPGEVCAETLRWWIANLAEAPDVIRAREASEFRRAVLRLALGVIEMRGLDWRWFRARPARDGGHTIVVQPSHAEAPIAFWSGKHGQSPRMSPELLATFDGLVARHVHVSLFMDHDPGDAPWVAIDWPPEVAMARSERDDQPVMLLDALRTVPVGARLL